MMVVRSPFASKSFMCCIHIGFVIFESLFSLSRQLDTTCAPVTVFPLDHDTLLLDSNFCNISTGSLLTCVKQCQFRQRCASYNFDLISGLCMLNEKTKNQSLASSLVNDKDFVFSDISTWPWSIAGACAKHNCSNTDVCREDSETKYECVITHCIDPPSVNSGSQIEQTSAFWEINETVQYQCNLGFEPVGERVCQPNGSWSYFECLRVATCADLKACNNDYGDGEYWLRPVAANRSYVKIYCHKMNTPSPENFITLEGENFSYFLDSDLVNCAPYWTGSHTGKTTFKKVKLNIWDFGFLHGAYTFAETDGKFGYYGRTGDCRKRTTCVASETGSFRIDTTGTGLKIVDYLAWSAGTDVTRSENGTVITGVCYADCKICKAEGLGFGSGMLKVELDNGNKPDFSAAIFPVCKVNV